MAEDLDLDVVNAASLGIQAHEQLYYLVNETLGTEDGAKDSKKWLVLGNLVN